MDNVKKWPRHSGALDEYLKTLEEGKPLLQPNSKPLKLSTAIYRRHRLKWLAENIFGDVLLENLRTPGQVVRLLDEDREWGSRGTRGNYVSALGVLFTWAVKQRYMVFNSLKGSDQARDTRRRKRVQSDTDWKRMLKAADTRGDDLSLFMRVRWVTRYRQSEALMLRWVDVGEDDGLLSLYFGETKNGTAGTVYTADKYLK